MKPNELSDYNLVNYLKKLFKVKLNATTGDEALSELAGMDHIYMPEGLGAETVIVYERLPVIMELWNLGPKRTLAKLALEIGDEDFFIIADSTLQGADSLFLCMLSSDSEDLGNIACGWSKKGCPRIITGGYIDKKHNEKIHLAAAQLVTII